MKRFLVGLAAIAILAISVISETNAHEYREVKEGRWQRTGAPRCSGYNFDLYLDHVEQNMENQPDEYRFSQFGHRVIITGLNTGGPLFAVTGEMSEEFIHFEILESNNSGSRLQVAVVEILEDEDELAYFSWETAHYADEVLLECSGFWYAGTCIGNEFVTGVPRYAEGYERYSVKCTGRLEWQGQ